MLGIGRSESTRAFSWLAVSLVIGSTALGSPARRNAETPSGAVLLELFTSEGCSSCPSADALLTQLATMSLPGDVELIPLSFHVDYWNGLGWKDPYSSPAFTARQREYAGCLGGRSVYTPQLIVDGVVGLVGSDREGILAAVDSAAKRSKAAITISTAAVVRESSGGLPIEVRVEPVRTHAGSPIEIHVSLTEDRLVSDVTRGENAGRRLQHSGVVRFLTSLGEWDLSGTDGIERTVQVPLGDGWNRGHLSVVVWLQEHACGRVVGARRLVITPQLN